MDWQIISALGGLAAAIAALGIALMRHVTSQSYRQGVTDTRLTTVEDSLKTGASLSAQVAALNATMAGFQATMAGFEKQLEHFSDTLRDMLNERPVRGRKPSPEV